MTESTLSSAMENLQQAVAHYLGMSLDPADWTDEEVIYIGMIIKRGLRQFYFPPKINENELAHEWSFLKPIATLTTIATYSTGTITISSGTCTLAGGVWPSWAATHGTLVVDNTEYTVTTRTSNTVLIVVGDNVAAGTEYDLRHDGNYDLADDFGGIEGMMTFADSEHKPPVKVVGEGMIRDLRGGQTARAYPQMVAIRPKETNGTDGQRFEAMFFPVPDDVYPLYYRKIILPENVGDSNDYPYGGASHADTIEASCIAAAELQEDGQQGPMYQHFIQRLTASISLDKRTDPDFLGYNGDNSDGADQESRKRHPQTFRVTYKGEI